MKNKTISEKFIKGNYIIFFLSERDLVQKFEIVFENFVQ